MHHIYNKDYHIDFMFINEDLTADFVNLTSKVQETSLLHSLACGYDMDWFLKNGKGFILTSYIIKVHRYPKWGESINISTWPSKFRGFIAKRSFKGVDSKGNMVIEVDSDWLYMDLSTKKPARIDAEMIERYGNLYPSLFDERVKIPDERNYAKSYATNITVRRSDIDSNHHVNNISYIRWAMNAIDDDTYNSHTIKGANIKYHKESGLGEKLVLTSYTDDNGVLSLIKDENGELRCSVFMEIS